MEKKPITLLLARTYTWSLIISLLSFFVSIYIYATENEITDVSALLLVLGLIFQWIWVISLGMCASRLGRRWLVWVGLTILLGPLSLLVVFPLMHGHISKARGTQ